jgi:hypothetical protein
VIFVRFAKPHSNQKTLNSFGLLFQPIAGIVAILVATILLLAWGPVAQAAAGGEKALWMGGAGGLMVPNKSGTSARSILGISAGAKLGTEFGLGAYYFASKKEEGGVIGKFDNDFYGVEGSYHFEGEARGAYFGLRLGITKMDFGTTPNQVSASPFHIGLIAGYNHWLTDFLSIGGDIGIYSISKGEATSQATGSTVTVDGYSSLNFLATLKFWL